MYNRIACFLRDTYAGVLQPLIFFICSNMERTQDEMRLCAAQEACRTSNLCFISSTHVSVQVRACAPRRKHKGDTMEDGKITAVRDNGSSTDIVVRVDNVSLAAEIMDKQIKNVSLQLVDGRNLSPEQRKKIYATLRDISGYTGYTPEEAKEVMKYVYITKTGCDYFSLSNCSMSVARDFINTLIDFCLEHGVIASERLSDRTDDIDTYLYQCIKYKKCAICGRVGEIHHWDAIGMGNDRKHYDDTDNRKICLCRTHHTIAHQKGVRDFERDYHVYGIVIRKQ